MGKSTHGAKLLLNNDSKDAFKISSELNNYNKERQLLEKELLKDIMDKDYGLTDEPVIVLYGEIGMRNYRNHCSKNKGKI